MSPDRLSTSRVRLLGMDYTNLPSDFDETSLAKLGSSVVFPGGVDPNLVPTLASER